MKPRNALARVRWHSEIGANGFDHLEPDHAAWNAQQSLLSICQILDQIDDTDNLVRILGVSGIEPRNRGE